MKQNFGILNHVPFGKLLNIIILASLIITSCGSPLVPPTNKASEKPLGKAIRWNTYVSPTYENPNPVLGDHANTNAPTQNTAEQTIQNLPIQFIENVGQFDKRSLFQAQVGNQTVFMAKDAFWFTIFDKTKRVLETTIADHIAFPVKDDQSINGVNLKLTFIGANEDLKITGLFPADAKVTYLGIGNISKTSAPVFEGIKYEDIYPGYNLIIMGKDGVYSWQFTTNDKEVTNKLSEIRLRVEGASSLTLKPEGIIVASALGDVVLPLPSFSNTNITSEAYLDGDEIVFPLKLTSFSLPHFASLKNSIAYEPKDFFQINSGINPTGYITILNGSYQDLVRDIDVDDLGQVYATGYTPSPDFPANPGAFNSFLENSFNTFVSKLDPLGNLVYTAFLGDSSGTGIAVDSAGFVYITGEAQDDLPTTTNAFDSSYNGFYDAFFAKLDPDGTQLLYSTYFGGSSMDWGSGIALDGNGGVYIIGHTDSSGNIAGVGKFPITDGAYDEYAFGGFVAKFTTGGQIIYSTAFRGYKIYPNNVIGRSEGYEYLNDIAVDQEGNAYITGRSSAQFLQTPGAGNGYDVTFNGGWSDAFIAKFNPSGSELLFATFLGGSNDVGGYEEGIGITLDREGNIYIVGNTNSPHFPLTSNALDTTFGGGEVFVSVFDNSGSSLIFSTFVGGSAGETSGGIAVDQSGNIYLTGGTYSVDFPVTPGAYDTSKNAQEDAFLTKISGDKTSLVYSTFFGATNESFSEYGTSIGIDPEGSAYIAGNMGTDVNIFVAKFDIYGNTVHEASVLSGCNVAGECFQSSPANSQGIRFGPINTRTGGLFYQTEDITVPTIAKELNFFRTYSSLATDLYSSTLGYGWAHNLDTRLIFPEDPEGEAGYVLFKAYTANLYRFVDNGNNTYAPASGVVGSLIFQGGQYVLTYPDQTSYTFDSEGKLQIWSDATGNTWLYTYNANNLVEQVSADGGARTLTLGYDGQGRIASVTDQAGRSIAYTYDANGDLVTASSLAGGTWQYEYDSAHRLTRVIDPNGSTDEQTEYDAQGRAIKQWDGEGNLLGTITYNTDGTTTITDPFNNVETHSYDSRLTLTESEDGGGGSTQKRYDKNFRPTSITDAANATTTLMWSADGASLTQVVDAEGGQTDITYDALNNPTSVIDPAGYLTTYAYDGTLLTGTTNALNQETTYTYTPEGFIESVTDPLGNTTSYTYDVYGQRTSMTDSIGNTWSYAYDSLGRLVDATDPLGRVSHSEYDAAGRLTRSVRNYDPNKTQNEDNLWNIVTEYEYDLGGNQTLVRDTYGRETEYQYDDADRLVKTIDADGNETTSTYNEAGQLVSTTDALGHATTYAYDAAGRLISSTDALGNSTTTLYNLDGTVASTSDALGRVTSYTYDDLKRVLTVTQSNGAVTSNSYDDNGNLIASTDALGNTTQYEYDALGRVIKTTDPLGNFTETFYDSAGRMVQTKDARGNATTYAYDDAGRQVSVTDALGNVTSYEYDDLGRRTAVIDAAGNSIEYTYDDLDRVIAVSNPLGNTVYTKYDALGQVLTRTDANGNDVTFEYNNLGQTTSQTDALGNVTSFGYDDAGNRLNTTNAIGAISSVTYDALNRPVVMIDPLGYSASTNYDAAGQVSSSTNANGEITTFTYNSLGQQATITDPLGNSTQYAYDAAGRMTSTMDANGLATAFEYDALGRLSAVIDNYKPGFEPATEVNVRTEYTYDENGNRLTISDGNGHVTNFTYDELNRLITETDPLGNTWTYAYDVLGNRISMTDANGETTYYSFDDANRLDGIDYTDNSDVEFSYDAGGRRTSMTDSAGTTSWTYDELNRPTAITDPFDTTVTYVYDSVGNLSRMLYPNKDVSYTYDAANRLTQVNDFSKVTGYEYDPLGRVSTILRANGVNTTYTYDAASRLTQLQHGTTETELASYLYTYDNTGNRVQAVEKVKTAGAGPTVRLTVVDTAGVLQTGKSVYAFSGETYTGTHAVTDANGQVAITLPQGDYRFRVDVDGTQFWSGSTNHCTIGQCDNLLVTIPTPVLAVVHDSDGTPKANVPVYAFIGTSYTGYHGTTNESGEIVLRLPEGNYSLRADFGGAQFWSTDLCVVAGCGIVPITVNLPVTVTVLDNISMPHAGIEVYAYDGTTYTGKHATTDENGQVQLALQNGNYRFRADFNGTQFWSGAENHCMVPTCREAGIAITLPLVVTVTDSGGSPQQGISVYAFNDTTYTGFNGVTDLDGRVTFTLPAGSYRFRADLNGTQFWSDTQNHCTVPDCSGAQVTVTSSTTITVLDTDNAPKVGVSVYAFNGTTYSGYHGITNANGQVSLTLPQGNYRFRADYNSTQFWSGSSNHCDVPGCSNASITVTNGVLVNVADTDGAPKAGLKVYAYNGTTNTGFNSTTNANGQVVFTLPQGIYRFRADLNGTQFWSGASNHCDIPGCGSASITVTNPVTVTVRDTDGNSRSGLKVYAFNGTTYTGFNAITNANGQVTLTLPLGSYRFRADFNGTQFWSGAANHCDIPGCANADVTVSIPLTVTVQIANGTPQTGIKVYAFNGTTYTGYNATTNASGQVILTLPLGSYRFRADFNGAQYWSGASNHCDVPGCLSLTVIVGPQPTATATVNATSTPTATMTETPLPATATPTPEATETASPTPEATATETPQGNGYQPGLILASVPNSLIRTSRLLVAQPRPQSIPPNDVTVTVLDTDSISKEGLNVYVFDEATYTGFQGTTDSNGQITFTLPDGNYRFRADLNGTQFWSGDANHCAVPDCEAATVTVNIPRMVGVLDKNEEGIAGITVYAFNGDQYTGYKQITDGSGIALFTLPDGGEYRFRADYMTLGAGNSAKFWSTPSEWCNNIHACAIANIVIATDPITVTVLDTDATAKEGLNVYVFDETTYTGYHYTTDVNGQAVFTLPFGTYRFRVDLNGTQFWSDTANHCDLTNGCNSAGITVTKPMTVTIADELNVPYADLSVYAFDGTTYTGYHSTTNASGHVMFTLPEGNYRFRADLRGVQYWSAAENTCQLPGCESSAITIPGGFEYADVTIDYTYDPLYRLTAADYSTGDFYHYAYDSVGNRLTQENLINGLSSTLNYSYDIANRLTDAGIVSYMYDANGNLLNDGTNTYAYDSANRLVEVDNGNGGGAEYTYNGLGDRLTQTAPSADNSAFWETTNYTLDLNAGLTQVLYDGKTTYTYGLGRISQQSGNTPEYFLGDALGSVRQMTDQAGAITFAQDYDPYGMVSNTNGTSHTEYGFTGEQYGDSTQLIYLRARYYNPADGRFQSRDTWDGEANRPLSLNRWMYVEGNPVNNIDPSGRTSTYLQTTTCTAIAALKSYSFLQFDVSDADMKGWSCDELNKVLDELNQFDLANGTSLTQIFTTPITVERVNKDAYCAEYTWGGDKIKVENPYNSPGKCASGAFGHELTHAWDHDEHINSKFTKYVGATSFLWFYDVGSEIPPLYGGGDPPNAREDFAESVTEYIYNQGKSERLPSNEKRWKFVQSLLVSNTILTSNTNQDFACMNTSFLMLRL